MRKPNLIFFLVLVAASCGISLSQVPVNPEQDVKKYLGKWKFIPKESFKDSRDRNLYGEYVILITQVGDTLRITRNYIYNSGKYTREYNVFLDGRGESNALADSNGKIGSVRSKTQLKEGKIWREIDNVDRRVGRPDTETFKLSEDGNRLTIDRSYTPKILGSVPKHFQDRVETDRLVLERVK